MTVTAPFLSWGWLKSFSNPIPNVVERMKLIHDQDKARLRKEYLLREKANVITARDFVLGLLAIHQVLCEQDPTYAKINVESFVVALKEYGVALRSINRDLAIANKTLKQ